MPSDERTDLALGALSASREAFRRAVVTTIEEVRGLLAAREAPQNGRLTHVAAGLGAFAAGKLDAERFGALFEGGEVLDQAAAASVRGALETLQQIGAAGDRQFCVDVAPGDDLSEAVRGALAVLGRAFLAARTVEGVRAGRTRSDESALAGFPFQRWNRAERQSSPPLVVSVDGADLHAAPLAEFLDGGLKLVLLVRGASPPAPLARLITPGVFVMQTSDPADLARLADAAGPGVAALVPEVAARFRHDPAGGARLVHRLEVQHLPEEKPARALGTMTAFQQAQELEQLIELAAVAATPPAGLAPAGTNGNTPAPAYQPADKLAAWLLRQANLSDL